MLCIIVLTCYIPAPGHVEGEPAVQTRNSAATRQQFGCPRRISGQIS